MRVTCLRADTYKIGALGAVPSDECNNHLSGLEKMSRGLSNRARQLQISGVKIPRLKAGEMAQRLRALAALLEDLSSMPSTHMVTHTVL